MADNREAIVQAVIARMKTVLIANGYNTNIGKNVFLWRMTPLNDNEIPGCSIRDPHRDFLILYSPTIRDYNLSVEVEAASTPGSATNTDLDKTIADLDKVFLEVDWTWGGLAINTAPDSDDKTYDHQAQKFGSVLARYKILYRKN